MPLHVSSTMCSSSGAPDGHLQVWRYLRLYNTILNRLFFFDVLLTMHLSIFILAINQLDAQNLFYNNFISCLYMFRAICAHRQEVKILLYSLWYHHTCRWPSGDAGKTLHTQKLFLFPLLSLCILYSHLIWWHRVERAFLYTDMRLLTTGILSEKCVVRQFRRCASVIECNLSI